ncbi:MAG: EscS/YscS/HrcS family type III secretion system export apparatus protein [Deltaproteobacteria bacterium]|mgnify:FL=1|nr:EscS/YscS/HrcS family type III secretion system export apparatus protein [Deltaproteobacteria bacterium]|tara:strand:- start:453 stop:731 length:279 start_codon:yes stop_codon:yes gene_type:complete
MDPIDVGNLLQHALKATFLMAAPMLGIGLLIGLLVSIVQAATQINEVTLVFIPKMLGVGITMWLLGPWMYEQVFILVQEVAAQISVVSGGMS